MESEYTKVYISLPRQFLEKLDRMAETEHQSRSALHGAIARLELELSHIV